MRKIALTMIVAISICGCSLTNKKGVGYLLDDYRVCPDVKQIIGTDGKYYESIAYRCNEDKTTKNNNELIGAIIFKSKETGDKAHQEMDDLIRGYKEYIHANIVVKDEAFSNNKPNYVVFKAYSSLK